MTRDEFFSRYRAAVQNFRTKNYATAEAECQLLKAYAPDWPKLGLLEAYLCRETGRYLSEIVCLHKVLRELEPTRLDERKLIADALSLLGEAHYALGQSRPAIKCLLASAEMEPAYEKKLVEHSNAIFVANAVPDFRAPEFHGLYIGYRRLLSGITPYERRHYHHRRVRVGYLSSDMRAHPVAYFLWPLLRFHNRENFTVYCYAANGSDDWATERLRRHADCWRPVAGATDAQIAKLVHDDEIDILIDLGGHTKGNHLPVLAYRPATCQMSGIGYMNSTGLYATDYFLSDAYCAASNEAADIFFTEKILALPHSHFCFAPLREMPDTKPAPCGQRGFVTFGCFNNFSKVTDGMLGLWAKILERVPNSRLLLKHKLFAAAEGREFTWQRLAALGLPPERVELRNYSADYLSEYHDVDIALDTFPYTGGLTTCEALYMGVPVISLYGGRHGTRFGLSLLANVGFGELAAGTPDEYVNKAVMLAREKWLLAGLHRVLRGQMARSALMDGANYTREAERCYMGLL